MFNGDRTQQDLQRLYLYTKFRISTILYPTKKDKIDYIRDYYGETLFNIIKAGFIDNEGKIGDYYHYYIVKEVIDLLDNSYGTYNPIAEVDATLYNPKFYIKNYKTFDLFLAKFTTIVAPLALIDTQKISALKRIIIYELAEKISDGQRATSFKDFATRLRQIDVNLRHYRRIHKRSTSRSSSRTTRTYLRGRRLRRSSRNSSNSSYSSYPNAYSHKFKKQFRKEGRCLKYLKRGYLSIDKEAPYRYIQLITYKEVKAARLLLVRGMTRYYKKE